MLARHHRLYFRHRLRPAQRIAQMATHLSSTTGQSAAATPPTQPDPSAAGSLIADIPKTWNFTSKLPPDQHFPTPAASHQTPRADIGPRQVRGALFTWVRPQPVAAPELLAVSPAAMRDLGIARGSERSDPDFLDTVAGNRLHGWDADALQGPGYPWAQCYGGFQFGQWAGQLGDGRAISLFETRRTEQQQQQQQQQQQPSDDARTAGDRYELQLKGAGLTPYSRFADGKAVLRSSIREFVVSEYLHAIGIPTTRALSLTLLPEVKVRREMTEPGAIVARFAQSWLRIGNFDILRARGDRDLIRRLATYVAEDVLGGWDRLPGRLDDPDKADDSPPPAREVPRDAVQGPAEAAENRFARLYREVVRRNAQTVARWQAYGFMNGVLNTDNTSLYGLSIDYGPFAFMDDFDPAYTPNHDDHALRYSYRNQPSVIWWNLVRLGESLGELLGAGAGVDEERFVRDGVAEADAPDVIARAEKVIMQAGEEYKAVFLGEYKRAMTARLGLRRFRESDFEDLFSGALDAMEALELDFNLFFRRLGRLPVSELATDEQRRDRAAVFFHEDGGSVAAGAGGEAEARKRLADWLGKWRERVVQDWAAVTEEEGREGQQQQQQQQQEGETEAATIPEARDRERMRAMDAVNPSFVPRSWILDEVIRRVEKEGDRRVLDRVMTMALHPFEDAWAGRSFEGAAYEGDEAEEARWTGDPPRLGRAMQCSCSS